jgi:ferredoxin-NADP reductase
MPSLSLKVWQIDRLTPRITRLLLVSADARPLPAFTAGAHLELHVPGDKTCKRAYSLVNLPGTEYYEIAVQREDDGSGGSRWVHSLALGDCIDAEAPRNHFPLSDDADHYLLIAAGIGITAILGMARALAARDQPFSLHYAGRDAGHMAYLEESLAFANAHSWISGGQLEKRLAVADILAAPAPGVHLYICGPTAMITSVLNSARELGWKDDQLHYELFAGALEQSGDQGFEVQLRDSGVTLQVGAGQSVLDAMIDAGLDPMFDCRRGDCGVCVAQVIEGTADHRDICLSERDRASGSFCTCVSRASSSLLVLDL